MITISNQTVLDIVNALQGTNKSERITKADLQLTTGYTERAIRAAVQKGRAMGYPIVSDSSTESGYYLASSPEEITPLIRDLLSRVNSMKETVRALEDTQLEMYAKRANFYED